MSNVRIYQNNNIESEQRRAILIARMVNYAAEDASELGLRECSQLLHFVSGMIRVKFNISNNESLGANKFIDNKDL